VNGVPDSWWLNTSVRVPPLLVAGPMGNGDVLIVVRQDYPNRRLRTLRFGTLPETKKSAGNVVLHTQYLQMGFHRRISVSERILVDGSVTCTNDEMMKGTIQ